MLACKQYFLTLLSICLVFVTAPSFAASQEGLDAWANALLTQMVRDGDIDAAFPTKVTPHLKYKARVIELDQKQPENKISFDTYKKRILSENRISTGKAKYKKHKALLDEISAEYNVQPKYIIALWGIETNYGSFTGGMQVLSSLATLAYEGRRSEFFTKEFKKAVKIAAKRNTPVTQMKGSWAGAMGQCQFMPSSYLAYAVDYNDDGDKDIWNSMPDVFASMANYLSSVGWDGDLRWGRAVKIPADFSLDLEGRKVKKSIDYWTNMHVTLPSGAALPKTENLLASIIIPDKDGKDAFIVYNNYNTLMHWNRSTYFATSVGLLADRIAGL
jgi:membrane-bound lytic murein transglycosylase B